jgi:Lar family restriction alleviation protein
MGGGKEVKEQMKPCPFCGNTNKDEFAIHSHIHNHYRDLVIYNACCSCGATGPDMDTKEEAVERWNKRREAKQ